MGGASPARRPRVLFSSPWYPEGYRSQAWDNPVTDFGDLQLTGHQDLFTLHGHAHQLFAHAIAPNLRCGSVHLEYPRREHFLAELERGYDFVGIHAFYNQVEAALEMCQAVRQRSPRSKVILGGYGALGLAEVMPPDELAPRCDYLCVGEGIAFMRKLLGDPPDAPVRLSHFPRGGFTLPWFQRYTPEDLGAVVASLGCPYGCDFCGTTKMFHRTRQTLIEPDALAAEVARIYEEAPTYMVAVYEEDSFLDHDYLEEVGAALRRTPIGLEAGLFVLGGVRSIMGWGEDRYARIARCGVTTAFLGVESKFAAEEGYGKRAGDVREVFQELHRHGVQTVGAWVAGWDFHTRENVWEDQAFFLSLKPTMHQLTTLCPFPGTDLYRRLVREGRIPDRLKWEELTFFGAGGGVKYKNFENHELFEIVHQGYRRSYELWGPSIMRGLEVALNGYEWALSTGDRDLAARARFHKRTAFMAWQYLPTAIMAAPNGMVRRWLKQLAARYERVIGAPTTMQRVLAALTQELARREQRVKARSGGDRGAEIPPPRALRYEFDGQDVTPPGARPWRREPLGQEGERARARLVHNAVSRSVWALAELTRLYDHLRRPRPEREVVDEATAAIKSALAPMA